MCRTNNAENLSTSVIMNYDRTWEAVNHSSYSYYRSNPSNVSAVIMMGTTATASSFITRMYLSLSKMYYAKRHGYDFSYMTSTEFQEYFPQDLFKVTNCLLAPITKNFVLSLKLFPPCLRVFRISRNDVSIPIKSESNYRISIHFNRSSVCVGNKSSSDEI